eukprot:6106918-Pleurochrysis_carterae.AAC.1
MLGVAASAAQPGARRSCGRTNVSQARETQREVACTNARTAVRVASGCTTGCVRLHDRLRQAARQ